LLNRVNLQQLVKHTKNLKQAFKEAIQEKKPQSGPIQQPESYRHLQAPLMRFSSHIPPLDHFVEHLPQFRKVIRSIKCSQQKNKKAPHIEKEEH
jgi:hypothetical protein